MSRSVDSLMIAGFFIILCAGCGGAEQPVAVDGHAQMLKLLEDIRIETFRDDGWFGEQPEKVERMLSRVPPNVPELEQLMENWALGDTDLRLNRAESAVEYYAQAYELFEGIGNRLPREMAQSFLLDLATANLRLGETRNCVHCQTGESCILPIRAGGVHSKVRGSQEAIKYYRILLQKNPQHVSARWLLNIAHMTLGTYPDQVPPEFLIPPDRFKSDIEFPRFSNIAGDVGLNIVNLAGGVITEDFDGDGYLDIVTSTMNTAGQTRYFRNAGDGTFIERTKEAGLIGLVGGLNMNQADYDNDGDIDILVLRGAWFGEAGRHPKSLLQNNGHGVFRDVTFEAGLGEVHYPTQTAAWADFDNDGDLDLYVGNENFPCQLFRNNGQGTFTDIAEQAGVWNGGFTKGVAWGDYDGDHLPDLYVSNLGQPNRLFHNNGNSTFTNVAPALGVTEPLNSFATWFWDFNNDGALDLYVAIYHQAIEDIAADFMGMPLSVRPACLYQGDGQGKFREVAREQKLSRVTSVMGSNFGDLDNDGFPDFYLGTGYPRFEALMPNLMYCNDRGAGFQDVTLAGGFGHLQKGHGIAFADLDGDGDQDVFSEMGGAYLGDAATNVLYENPGFGNHWLRVALIGRESNRFGVGARIRADVVENGVERAIYKWVNSGGSFGANSLTQQLGVGQATRIKRLSIDWPTTGRTQEFPDVPADQFIEITEGADSYRKVPSKPLKFTKRPSVMLDQQTSTAVP